jgi:ribonuclease-3
LYKTYPEYKEGDYTDIKAAIVNTNSLYEAAKLLGLGEYLYLSKGEQENKGRDNVSILADCFEALIGTIYLEHGFDTSYNFINTYLFRDVLDNIVKKRLYLPAKNILQEYYQDKFKKLPSYKVLSETGPEHNKVYVVGVFDNDKKLGDGSGKSKKQGEEEAARSALQKLGI